MLKRSLALACLTSASLAIAEPQRALLTHENKFPELHQVEVGVLGNYTEYELRDERAIGPYARYGLLENLTLNASVPYKDIEPQNGSSESGIGDANIGLELRAWQDIFDYPFVIPHVDVDLSTGDEDKGLGSGEAVTTFGISVGTVTYDCLHWIGDVSYAVNGGHEQPDPDNVFILAGSIIWDISDQFSVLFEANVTDEDTPNDERPSFYQGGLTYDWTDNLMMGLYFGAARGSPDDADGSATVKFAYTF